MKIHTTGFIVSILITSICTLPLTATRPAFYLGNSKKAQPAIVANRMVAPSNLAETNSKITVLWNALIACLPCSQPQHIYSPVNTPTLTTSSSLSSQ